MNVTEAKKRLAKLFGKDAAWRVDEKAPRAAEREIAAAQLPVLSAAVRKAAEQRDAKRAELLADPVYLALVADHDAARKEQQRVSSITRHYRVTIGTASSFFFTVRGEGDNWAEAFEDFERRSRPRSADTQTPAAGDTIRIIEEEE